MNLSEFLKYFIEQLTNLGHAALTLVKILLGILITVFEFLIELLRKGLEAFSG